MDGQRQSKQRRNIPLCKFGPGGQFVSSWPREPVESYDNQPDVLGRVLATIAEMIGAVFSPESFADTVNSANITETIHSQFTSDKRKGFKSVTAKNQKATVAPAIAVVKGGSGFSGQQMLFPDASAVSLPIRHKPKHRIRAYRRPSRKATVVSFAGQGSLFETHVARPKTA